jgi:hypothetical protein
MQTEVMPETLLRWIPLTAGTASTTCSSGTESWVLAADRRTADGIPFAVDQGQEVPHENA